MSEAPLDTGLIAAAQAAPPPAPPVEKTGDELRKEAFIQQVLEARKPAPPAPAPPPQSPRQLDQTKREMAKGADRVEFSKEQERLRPPRPAPGPSDAYMAPVFRPAEYQHESKHTVPFKG
jgi:hypothetical protein